MLSMLMCIQILVKFCPLVLKILSGNKILTSIKGCNSAPNLPKMTLYNPNLDLINCNLYTKFGNSVTNLRKLTFYNPNLDIINVNVHTRFG